MIFCPHARKRSVAPFLVFQALSQSLYGFHSTKQNHDTKNMDKSPMQTKNKQKIVDIREISILKKHKLWFIQNPSFDLITIGIRFDLIGSAFDPKNQKGLTSLLLDYLNTCGAGSFDRISFQKNLLRQRIQYSITEDQDAVTLLIKVPSTHLKEAFKELHLLVTNPNFNQEDFTLVKQKAIAGLQQSDHDPDLQAKEAFKKRIFSNDHPYAVSSKEKLGFIKKAELSDLQNFFQNFFHQTRIDIAATGSIDLNLLTQELENFIQSFKTRLLSDIRQNDQILHLGETIKHYQDIPQTIVWFAHKGLGIQHPDYFKLELLLAILGKTPFESRLWQEIREKRGLCYALKMSQLDKKQKVLTLGYFATTPTSEDQAIQLVKQEIKKIQEKGVTQEEIDLHKRYILGSYPLSFDTSTSTINNLLGFMGHNLDPSYVNDLLDQFQQVTQKEINSFAKSFINPDQIVFFSYGRNGVKTDEKS